LAKKLVFVSKFLIKIYLEKNSGGLIMALKLMPLKFLNLLLGDRVSRMNEFAFNTQSKIKI
jgi:hypothetical protein